MLKNYLRVALRSLARNKFAAAINIGGLAIGMAIAILIGLWIYDELTFDHATPNHDRIAAVLKSEEFNGIQTWWTEPMQLAPVLRKNYGNLFKYVVLDAGNGKHLITRGDKQIKPSGNYTEPQIFDLLQPKMLAGNYHALDDPNSIVLSASAAKSLFGDSAVIGKLITLDNAHPLKVTGVFADLPGNSSFAGVHFIAPFKLLAATEQYDEKLTWGNSWFRCYVALADNVTIDDASKAISGIIAQYNPDGYTKKQMPTLFAYPLDRWHLHSEFKNGVSTGGRITYVRLYSIIGAFILLLACINFMNLSTARSEKRAREVGIRKTLGSRRRQLVVQFFGESLLIAFAAFLLALLLAQLLLSFFNQVADKQLAIPWGQPLFWLAGLGFVVLTGLLAGSYPALFLSAFRPVKVLKSSFRVGRHSTLPRKVLVTLQFTVSVVLIVGTIVVFRQVQYAKDRPVGFTRNGLLTVPLQTGQLGTHIEALREDLKATGYVDEIAASEASVGNIWITNSGFTWRGKDPAMQDQFVTNGITPEFGQVIGWSVLQGRDFLRGWATDSNALIINESAARYMKLRNPVGEVVRWGKNGLFTIVGVVGDMISESPYQHIPPMIFFLNAYRHFAGFTLIDLRLKPQAAMSPALAAISSVFKKLDPQDLFEYQFVDEEYGQKFEEEERIARLAGFFTLLAIFISCLGLLGLSAFVAEQRTREIGIRKVLGASVFNLWNLLSREFISLVGLALVIGSPIAFLFMKNWLDGYEYHAGLSWWIFAITALGAIGITLLTVSFQSVKAALANPAKSLRTE